MIMAGIFLERLKELNSNAAKADSAHDQAPAFHWATEPSA
jgi:hypothetical protein